ncbi:DUF2147 domain-containing protein [Aestuariivirga sp. YIM B02566]|uniref:DUF2147 domain-containing protein n=1 Tax=Taklimakanibacter albus TaxID=2800327 RepID=A0ACC5R2D3_9HYPH|nr:DUF2147 domain-containing protein [Aestuariivirga sp. YIM B02566]MBK1866767.1 DUF2147 domain-containing protein [Aestuariivirga sp. YIM B02566]
MKTISLAVLGLLATTGFAFAADPSGTWRLDNGKITVKVRQCGGEICANIVGLKEPTYKDGKAKIDKYNKNPALRNRPLMGLAVLSNMKPSGDGTWAGNIYNADDGRTYNATMTMSGNTMKLKGCVAGIFCKTNTFKKVN